MSKSVAEIGIPSGTYAVGTGFAGFSSKGMMFSFRGLKTALSTAPNK